MLRWIKHQYARYWLWRAGGFCWRHEKTKGFHHRSGSWSYQCLGGYLKTEADRNRKQAAYQSSRERMKLWLKGERE